MYIAESIMYKISETLEIDIDELRLRESVRSRPEDPFSAGDHRRFSHRHHAGAKLSITSDFENRKAAIKVFNTKNHFKKRGISKIPSKFGLRCVLRLILSPFLVYRFNSP